MIGTPSIDEMRITEESIWIRNQLISGVLPLFGEERHDLSINKDDIQEIPFTAMYHNELCLTLLKDSEHQKDDDVD
ncbi:hypothetical protein PTKIN_Ptkin09bG0146900 [Pterospermum kingtungense]